jgi:hypothetical protein
MVVKEGTRTAKSGGDSIRRWAPGSEYDADVRWWRMVRASDLNLRWGLHLECYEAWVDVGHARDLNSRWERCVGCDEVHIWVDREEREERAGDLTERCRASSKRCEARHERCEEKDTEATADVLQRHRGAVSSEGANRRPKRDGS